MLKNSLNYLFNKEQNKCLLNFYPFFIYILFLASFYSIFDVSFYQGVKELTSNNYWQFLPSKVLKGNFLEAITYLHSRPPLGNMILGVGFFLGIGAKIFIWFNHLACAFLFYYTFCLIHWLSGERRVSFVLFLIAIYLMSLNILVFLHDILYTLPVAAFLVGIVWHSIQILRRQEKKDLLCFAFLSILISLYRATYGLPFFLVIFILFAVKSRRLSAVLSFSCLPLILVSLKNYYIFSFFGITTLFGLTLYNNAAITNYESKADLVITQKIFAKLIKENPKYSSILKVDNLRKISAYEKAGYEFKKEDKFESVPALQRFEGDSWWGDSNKNAYEYIELSTTFLEVSKKIIIGHPLNYLRNCGSALFFFLKPSWMYKQQMQGLDANHNTHPYLFDVYNLPKVDPKIRAKYGIRISEGYDLFPYAFFPVVLILMLILFKPFMLSRLESLFFLTVIFFGTASSVLVSYAESMRYKFEIEPLIYALFFGLIGYTLNYLYVLSGHVEDLTSDESPTREV